MSNWYKKIYEMNLLVKIFIVPILLTFLNFVDCADKSIVSITRHYLGDIYIRNSTRSPCECMLGSFPVGTHLECQCQCQKDLTTFRDDKKECVSDISECSLAEFVSSSQVEKIPYVYIPHKGQLVHPTAEIALTETDGGMDESQLSSPICIVTKSQYLTTFGWMDILNSTIFEPPFRIFLNSGRNYLQWVGDIPEKLKCHGRLLLIQLLCRDSAKANGSLFHPCVAVKVAGSALHYVEDSTYIKNPIEEVITEKKNMSTGEIIAISVVLGVLILAYIVVSLIYWKIKKERKRYHTNEKALESGIPRRRSGNYNAADNKEVKPCQFLPKTSLVSSEDDSDCGDIEDLSKTNKRNRNSVNFVETPIDIQEEEIYSTPSEEEENEGRRLRLERLRMELHKHKELSDEGEDDVYEAAPSPQDLSVIETLASGSEANTLGMMYAHEVYSKEASLEHSEFSKEKKLYFNPSYFEPQNLQAPPPSAIEFLSKVRDMISVAKFKMQNKVFQPSLIDIPEDDYSLRTSGAASTASNSKILSKSAKEEICDHSQEPVYNELINNKEKSSSSEKSSDEEKSQANTLKRLAQRVNTHGQTLVSELIRSLDFKPRYPDTYYNPYPASNPNSTSLSLSSPEIIEKKNLGKPAFPELVKPSMLRNAVKKEQEKEHGSSTFENFRQEILATLNKVKANSPIPALNRTKSNANNINERNPRCNNKVHKWLQALEGGNNFAIVRNETNSAEFDSTSLSNKLKLPIRSMSFSHKREQSQLSNMSGSNDILKNIPYFSKQNKSIERSNSLKKEQLLLRQQMTSDHNSNFIKDSLYQNDDKTITNISKIYDTYIQERFPPNIKTDFNSESPLDTNQAQADNEINNNDTKQSNNLLTETNINTNGTGVYGNPFHSEHENSYEEIQFGSLNKKPIGSINLRKNIKEVHILKQNTIDEGKRCSIYSNPEALISEIHIGGNPIRLQSSNNRLSIEVTDDTLSSDNDDIYDKSLSTGKKKTRRIKRNDSIIQDSLERPKVKKKLSNADKKEIHENNKKILSDDLLQGEESSVVKRNKTLRTFRDYHLMKFNKNPDGNRLSLMGEGIHFNFKNSHESSNANSAVFKPPLPPKSSKHCIDSNIYSEYSSSSYSTGLSETAVPILPPKHKLRHSASLVADIRKNKAFSLYSDDAPALPPKLKPKHSFSGIYSHSPELPPKPDSPISLTKSEIEPPELPVKYRKRSNSDVSSNQNRNSIPELSEYEENSILHGTLSQINNKGNFLDNGSIADENDSSMADNAPSSETNEQPNTKIKNKEYHANNGNLKRSHSMSHLSDINLANSLGERVRGQFILSNNGPLTLKRQRSFARECNVINQLKQITANLEEAATDKGIDSSLSQTIKGELEKHFKENSGADSVKRTWRKVLEKVDSFKGHDQLTLKDLQNYIQTLEAENLEVRAGKQEDSGYHSSTDSNDSSRIPVITLTESIINSLKKTNLSRNETIANSSDLMKRTAGFFQRPAQVPLNIENLDINLAKKNSIKLRNMSTNKDTKQNFPMSSLYINESFTKAHLVK